MTKAADPSAGATWGKLLCIEDNAVSMAFVEAALADMPGVELVRAVNGAEGVRLARALRPDLILLDMHLPDFDGLEVVRELNIEIADGLKVVILTGDTFSTDVVKAMSLGAREYWVKPVDAQRLRDGVVRYLRGSVPGSDRTRDR